MSDVVELVIPTSITRVITHRIPRITPLQTVFVDLIITAKGAMSLQWLQPSYQVAIEHERPAPRHPHSSLHAASSSASSSSGGVTGYLPPELADTAVVSFDFAEQLCGRSAAPSTTFPPSLVPPPVVHSEGPSHSVLSVGTVRKGPHGGAAASSSAAQRVPAASRSTVQYDWHIDVPPPTVASKHPRRHSTSSGGGDGSDDDDDVNNECNPNSEQTNEEDSDHVIFAVSNVSLQFHMAVTNPSAAVILKDLVLRIVVNPIPLANVVHRLQGGGAGGPRNHNGAVAGRTMEPPQQANIPPRWSVLMPQDDVRSPLRIAQLPFVNGSSMDTLISWLGANRAKLVVGVERGLWDDEDLDALASFEYYQHQLEQWQAVVAEQRRREQEREAAEMQQRKEEEDAERAKAEALGIHLPPEGAALSSRTTAQEGELANHHPGEEAPRVEDIHNTGAYAGDPPTNTAATTASTNGAEATTAAERSEAFAKKWHQELADKEGAPIPTVAKMTSEASGSLRVQTPVGADAQHQAQRRSSNGGGGAMTVSLSSTFFLDQSVLRKRAQAANSPPSDASSQHKRLSVLMAKQPQAAEPVAESPTKAEAAADPRSNPSPISSGGVNLPLSSPKAASTGEVPPPRESGPPPPQPAAPFLSGRSMYHTICEHLGDPRLGRMLLKHANRYLSKQQRDITFHRNALFSLFVRPLRVYQPHHPAASLATHSNVQEGEHLTHRSSERYFGAELRTIVADLVSSHGTIWTHPVVEEKQKKRDEAALAKQKQQQRDEQGIIDDEEEGDDERTPVKQQKRSRGSNATNQQTTTPREEEVLKARYVELLNQSTRCRSYPPESSAYQRAVDLLRLFLEEGGVSMEDKDIFENSLLHYACCAHRRGSTLLPLLLCYAANQPQAGSDELPANNGNAPTSQERVRALLEEKNLLDETPVDMLLRYNEEYKVVMDEFQQRIDASRHDGVDSPSKRRDLKRAQDEAKHSLRRWMKSRTSLRGDVFDMPPSPWDVNDAMRLVAKYLPDDHPLNVLLAPPKKQSPSSSKKPTTTHGDGTPLPLNKEFQPLGLQVEHAPQNSSTTKIDSLESSTRRGVGDDSKFLSASLMAHSINNNEGGEGSTRGAGSSTPVAAGETRRRRSLYQQPALPAVLQSQKAQEETLRTAMALVEAQGDAARAVERRRLIPSDTIPPKVCSQADAPFSAPIGSSAAATAALADKNARGSTSSNHNDERDVAVATAVAHTAPGFWPCVVSTTKEGYPLSMGTPATIAAHSSSSSAEEDALHRRQSQHPALIASAPPSGVIAVAGDGAPSATTTRSRNKDEEERAVVSEEMMSLLQAEFVRLVEDEERSSSNATVSESTAASDAEEGTPAQSSHKQTTIVGEEEEADDDAAVKQAGICATKKVSIARMRRLYLSMEGYGVAESTSEIDKKISTMGLSKSNGFVTFDQFVILALYATRR